VIRDRKLRTKDGTVLEEDEELNKVFEDIGNLTEDQREIMNNASTFAGTVEVPRPATQEWVRYATKEIEHLQGRNESLEQAYKLLRKELLELRKPVNKDKLTRENEQLTDEVTMLRKRLTRWAKVITEMYEQVTREILF